MSNPPTKPTVNELESWIEAVKNINHLIGIELQGIPKEYRQRSISRLIRKAKELEELGAPRLQIEMIRGLCEGWEDFSEGGRY